MKRLTGWTALVLVVLGGYWWQKRPVVAPGANSTEQIEAQKPSTPTEITLQYSDDAPSPLSVEITDGPRTWTCPFGGRLVRKIPVLFVPVEFYGVDSYVDRMTSQAADAMLDELLVDGAAKVYRIEFFKPVPGGQLMKAIKEEIDAGFTDVDMDRLRPNIDAFTNQFANGASKGDAIHLVWLPDGRLYSSFNQPGRLALLAEDVPLVRAIWRIWCGERSGPERFSLVEKLAAKPTEAPR